MYIIYYRPIDSKVDDLYFCLLIYDCLSTGKPGIRDSRNARFQYLRSKNVEVQFLSCSFQRTLVYGG